MIRKAKGYLAVLDDGVGLLDDGLVDAALLLNILALNLHAGNNNFHLLM